MAKKAKPADPNLAATVRESAQQIWLAGLGAFSKAQEEGNKVFDALVRQGESLQAKTRKLAQSNKVLDAFARQGESIAKTRKLAEGKVNEMAAKATGTWDKLEQVFENRVAKALNSLGVPTKGDLDVLAKRVSQLKAEVDKLNGKPAAKTAAKPVARRASRAAKVAK